MKELKRAPVVEKIGREGRRPYPRFYYLNLLIEANN